MDLARSYVGIAVKAGATPSRYRHASSAARRLARRPLEWPIRGSAPAAFSSPGLIDRIGIAAAINARATIVPQGFTAERLITGEADLAVQQLSELKQVEGIEVVGPIPLDWQTPAVFSAGRLAASKQAAASDALLQYLASPEVAPVLRKSGLEP